MLLLNHKCSYKTFCATPAATCPPSPRDSNTGHLRSYRNGLWGDSELFPGAGTCWVWICLVRNPQHSQGGVTGWMQLNHSKASPGSTSCHGHHPQRHCPWMGNTPKCPRKDKIYQEHCKYPQQSWRAAQSLREQPGWSEQELCPGRAAVKGFRQNKALLWNNAQEQKKAINSRTMYQPAC